MRTLWYAHSFRIKDEPLAKSLIEYRLKEDRELMSVGPGPSTQGGKHGFPNLISSLTTDGKHMPILDLDFPHRVEPSTTPGHSHLYLDVPISKWRWFVLMSALRFAGVIELGFYVWSIRRGANFVRLPDLEKTGEEEFVKPRYGWFFKLKERKNE